MIKNERKYRLKHRSKNRLCKLVLQVRLLLFDHIHLYHLNLLIDYDTKASHMENVDKKSL